MGVAGKITCPIEFGLGNEPGGQNGQGEVMLPGEILGGLDLIPAEFGFSILVGAFDEEALALALCQDGERGVVWRVAEGIITFSVTVPAHDQPFLPNMMNTS